MTIGLAVDYLDTELYVDEILILQAFLNRGVIPTIMHYSHRTGIEKEFLEDLDKVVNRLVHRRGRVNFAQELEESGITVLSSYSVEGFCRYKPAMKEVFKDQEIPTAPYHLTKHPLKIVGGTIRGNEENIEEIADSIQEELGFPVAVKPTSGSRGKSIIKVNGKEDFIDFCSSQRGKPRGEVPSAFYRNSINPGGLFLEEFLPHPLDLRCLVSMKRGRKPEYLGCLARVGRSDEEEAKNTALGAIPVGGIDSPQIVEDISLSSVRAMLSYIENDQGPLIVGVDIIPVCDDLEVRRGIYEVVRGVSDYKDSEIEGAKDKMRATLDSRVERFGTDLLGILYDEKFEGDLANLDRIFGEYRSSEEYKELQRRISTYLRENMSFYVAEINASVDFGTNTRNLTRPLQEDIVDVVLTTPN